MSMVESRTVYLDLWDPELFSGPGFSICLFILLLNVKNLLSIIQKLQILNFKAEDPKYSVRILFKRKNLLRIIFRA